MAGRPAPNGRCTLCNHAERARIELLMAGGASRNATARKFSLHPDVLNRHWARHVSAERRAVLLAGPVKLSELAERAAKENMTLLDYLAMVRSGLSHQFIASCEAGDRQGAALLSGRLLECLRIVGSMTGDLQRTASTVTNNTLILSSPVMTDLQQMLIQRLRPYPEAARAVLEGLEQLSARALNDAHAAAPALEHSAA